MSEIAPTSERVRTGWDGIAVEFDQFVTPKNAALAERVLRRVQVAAGARFLDVAAGSGALSLPAAQRGAQVVAVDFAPRMIELLDHRARAEKLPNLTARVMDGLALEFADGVFDICASQHGVSTFPDVRCGLSEMVRVTRPGGAVVIVAFGPIQKAEFIRFFVQAVRAVAPESPLIPMDPPPLPFQLSDPAVLMARLNAAGLADVVVDSVTAEVAFGSAREFWNAVAYSNPIAAGVTKHLTPEQHSDALTVLDGMFRERSDGHPGAVLHTAINIGTGIK